MQYRVMATDVNGSVVHNIETQTKAGVNEYIRFLKKQQYVQSITAWRQTGHTTFVPGQDWQQHVDFTNGRWYTVMVQ